MAQTSMTLYASVVEAIAGFHIQLRHRRRQALAELVPAIVQQSTESREQSRLTSTGLNVFRFFSPGETTHSRLLAFFLDPRASHGQGALFLVEFLRLLKISEPDRVSPYPWIVTAEIGRVDVLIKRARPHTVVVIENKSNYATDQPNQLYRYWHQEIYSKQLERGAPAHELGHPPKSHYRIVYLSPHAGKQAESHSLRRPQGWHTDLPETVPEELIEHRVFGEFVLEWLQQSFALLPPANHRLREFTAQYMQFWQSH